MRWQKRLQEEEAARKKKLENEQRERDLRKKRELEEEEKKRSERLEQLREENNKASETSNEKSISETVQDKENKQPFSETKEEVSINQPTEQSVVLRRKLHQPPPQEETERSQKSLSSLEPSSIIPSQVSKSDSQTSQPPQDSRRITVHGTGVTPDQLMQKVNEDEQKRKASYQMLRNHSGISTGLTRSMLYGTPSTASGIGRVSKSNAYIQYT